MVLSWQGIVVLVLLYALMWCYVVVCDDDGVDMAVFDDMAVGAGMTMELTW
jgi:hypothetical protein